jgi:Holliday junction resolvase
MKGGAGPYRKGAAFERECQKYLEGKDFLVVRQPKSQSPFDLLASRKTFRILVQCKLNGKISKKEKQGLMDLADKHYYSAVLAWKKDGEIHMKYLYNNETLRP